MIQNKQTLVARISGKGSLKASLNNAVVKEYPELENLEVTPSGEQQVFKSKQYGYDTVTVNAVESEELNIMPSTEEQIYSGLYSNVIVAGDSNLAEENIKEGVSIFGKKGTAKTTNARITNAGYLFHNGARTDFLDDFIKMLKDITDATYMFGSNSIVQNIPFFNTEKVKNMSRMFDNCTNLTSIPELDASEVSNVYSMFSYSNYPRFPQFTTMGGFKNLGKAYTQKTTNYTYYKLDLSYCVKLTHESLMNVINNLYDLNLTYDVANGGTLYTQSLVLGSTNKAKLTAEEIAIATNKGWTVS